MWLYWPRPMARTPDTWSINLAIYVEGFMDIKSWFYSFSQLKMGVKIFLEYGTTDPRTLNFTILVDGLIIAMHLVIPPHVWE